MELVTTVLIGVVLYLIYYIAYLNENYWKNLGVPILKGPKPFFGNAKNLFGQKKSFTEHLHDIYNEFTTEKYFGMLSFRCPIFVPRDPELINTILIKNFNNFHDRFYPKHGSDLVCDAIIHVPGERWRNLRYKLTPAFTSGKLKMMFNGIKECTDEVVTHLKSHQNEDIEGKDLMFKFIINVVGSVAFGLKVDSLNEGGEIAERFLEATNNFFSPNPKMMLKSVISMICPKIDSLLKFNLIEPEQNKFFNDLINGIIKQREKSGVRRNDFLQILIDNRQKEQHNIHDHIEVEEPEDSVLINQLKHMKSVSKNSSATNQDVFTDECIASQTFTFISGGSETTSTILSFALYELALNQEIQKKLQNEIDIVIKANGLHYDTLRKFTYMDQVLHEVLRKYPTLGAVMRVCTEDFKIPNTNITIEKDTIVSIPVMGLHKDPQYFPDPEKFDPDRFKNMDAIPKGAYLPFGAGPRMCVAVRLAMVEMKICLAMLLSNFNLTLSKKTSIPLEMVKQSIVLKPECGVWVQFSERK